MKKIIISSLILIIVLSVSGCGISVNKNKSTQNISGLYKSKDRGESWEQKVLIATAGGKVQSIANVDTSVIVFDPQDSAAFYLGTTANGLFYTYDGANSWHKTSLSGYVNDVKVDWVDKCTIYVALNNKVVRSDDCSRSWIDLYIDNKPDNHIRAIAQHPNNLNILFAGTKEGGLLRSNDGGASWFISNWFNSTIKKIFINKSNPGVIYVATAKLGIFRTIDDGKNWEEITQNILNSKNKKVGKPSAFISGALDPSSFDHLIFTPGKGLFETFDGGQNWKDIELVTKVKNTAIYAVAISPDNNKHLYYVTNRTFYKSDNGGAKWITKQLPAKIIPSVLIVDPDTAQTVYMGVIKIKEKK